MRLRRRNRPPLRRRIWRRVKRLLGRDDPLEPRDPPDWEPALVPVGPPRRPRPSTSIALELPDEPDDIDAYGRAGS